MTAKHYFGNRMALVVNDGSDHTMAALHGAEFTVSAEHIEAYSMDSIERDDVARVKVKVDVKVKYAKFDPVVASWWQMGILSGTAGTMTGATVDTNSVALFDIEGLLKDGAATDYTDLKAVVSDVYFPSMPLVISENQWVQMDLSGVGKSVTFSNPTRA